MHARLKKLRCEMSFLNNAKDAEQARGKSAHTHSLRLQACRHLLDAGKNQVACNNYD
jgi:methyl coenzyme M reductase gamma subunit